MMENVPHWVPIGVIRAAGEYGNCGETPIKMVDRLVCDAKMQSVWKRVFSTEQHVNEKGLSALPTKYRCLDEQDLTVRDRSAASLFLIGLEELTNNVAWSAEQSKEDLARYDQVIETCQLYRHVKFLEPIEANLRGQTPARDQDLSSALKKTAEFFEHLKEAHLSMGGVRWNHQKRGAECKARQTRVVSAMPRLDQVSRARTSAMIDLVDRIFNPPLRTPLATIASVALSLDVTAKDIENLRRNLKRHRAPKI